MVKTLVARGLSYQYPDGPQALREVHFELAPRSLTVMVGPNGSGKSTLLRCLAGLITPDAGEVRLGELDVGALPSIERARRLAVVPQFLTTLFDVRVEDFVLGGRYAYIDRWRGPTPADTEAVRSALVACDADDLRRRAMSELSGGQRQRVVVARAVAQNAPILLVDEPTTSLDPEHQIQVFELLARLTCEERAVLVVTHELNLAAQFADALAVMSDGRVIARGSVDEILRAEVLAPVYGSHLHFGRDVAGRPFVLPSRTAQPR